MQAQLKTNTPLSEQMKDAARQRLQAQTEASGILQSGVTAENIVNPEVIAQGKTKTYYHQVPGASFYMPDGLRVLFAGGQFTTDEQAIIHELEKIVNKGTSLVSSAPAMMKVDPVMEQVALDARGTVGTGSGALPLRAGS